MARSTQRLLSGTLLSRVPLVWCRRNGAQRATQAVIPNDLLHAQDARGHAVPAQHANVRVTVMTIQDRQHPRAQDINQSRRVGADVAQRAALHPVLEQPRGIQVLGKKGQLPHRRGATSVVPANVEHTARRAHPHVLWVHAFNRRNQGLLSGLSQRFQRKFLLTHRVPPRIGPKPAPSLCF